MCLAIPGLVLSTTGEALERTGLVRFGQVERKVNLAFTPEAVPGDYVLVHVGCAISLVDAAEAARMFELLEAAEIMSAVEGEPG